MASSYKEIFKGTAIFGGTQIIQVLVGLIRLKLVSILIGAKGMGINSLYTSSLVFIQNFAGLGLKDSSVRNISIATSGDEKLIAHRLTVINNCFYFSYGLGVVITLLLSPILSMLSFKCYDYTINYGFLSLYVLFQLQFQHYIAILQGFRKLKTLAIISITNSILGLVVSAGLYYLWGVDGIVPNIIVTSLVCMVCVRIPVQRMKLPSTKLSIKESLREGKDMVSMGIVLTISVLIGTGVNYFINTIITRFGNVEDIGFFQAAVNITTQSVSLIFAAMTADYYPRLAKVCDNREEMISTVNKQSEVLFGLGTPILALMIVFSNLIIKILLTNEFLVIVSVIKLLCVGSLMQIFSYPIGHISFAKGDKKFFFFYEGILSSFLRLILYSIGYIYGGLIGLALSVNVTNLLYSIMILFATKRRYQYRIGTRLLLQYICVVFLFYVLIIVSFQENIMVSFLLQIIILSLLLIYSIKYLDDRIGIVDFIKNKIRK